MKRDNRRKQMKFEINWEIVFVGLISQGRQRIYVKIDNTIGWRGMEDESINNYVEKTLTLCGAEALIDGTCCPHCCSVNAPIEEEHHQHWQVKWTQGWVDYIATIVGQLTCPGTLFLWRCFSCWDQCVIPMAVNWIDFLLQVEKEIK